MPEPSRETNPMFLCPRFPRCSAPRCPLDLAIATRWAVPGEAECSARRSTREAIAARYAELTTGGLTPKETSREKRRAAFAALPAEAQERRRARLAEARALKHGGITPMLPSGHRALAGDPSPGAGCPDPEVTQ